jgi:hypothetical protein
MRWGGVWVVHPIGIVQVVEAVRAEVGCFLVHRAVADIAVGIAGFSTIKARVQVSSDGHDQIRFGFEVQPQESQSHVPGNSSDSVMFPSSHFSQGKDGLYSWGSSSNGMGFLLLDSLIRLLEWF